jgi:ubiquinone biosynthesis protein UbiJ
MKRVDIAVHDGIPLKVIVASAIGDGERFAINLLQIADFTEDV